MGKYMRKAKLSGEVAVMEVAGGALLGVRTRSRTLALQRLQRPAAGRDGEEEGAAAEYLELRSRRLEKSQLPKEVAGRRCGGKKAPATEEEVEVEVSFGENVLELEAMERSTRETTPCSLIRDPESISTPGSTTRTRGSMNSHRRAQTSSHRIIPSSLEMEEFFAAAEHLQQQAFMEKYNFCPMTDCPLPGQYEWVKLDC